MEGIKIMPFSSLAEFYREYISEEVLTEYEHPQQSPFASKSTFINVYKSKFKATLRCMRCKGNHSTCFVCVNAAMILSQGKRSISSGRKLIVVEYRRRHLTTQEEERAEYDRISQKCKNERDLLTGAPLCFQVV
jgi:hypothetical protein